MTQDLMTRECRPNILIVMYDQLTFDAAYTNSPLAPIIVTTGV